MKVEYWEEEFIRNSIKACEQKRHLQQVAFSTFHNCLTQICFTCNICMTSLPELEQTKIKRNQSLKAFEGDNSQNHSQEDSVDMHGLETSKQSVEVGDTPDTLRGSNLGSDNNLCQYCGHEEGDHNEKGKGCSLVLKSKYSINGEKCPCTHFTPLEIKQENNINEKEVEKDES